MCALHRLLLTTLLLSASALLTAPAHAAAISQANATPTENAKPSAQQLQPQITEWQVPWPDSRPRDPYIGGPDLIWFVGQKGDYVASFTPSSASFRQYPLPEGTGPHTVIADARGAWFAGNRVGHIGLLNPASGTISTYALPGTGARDVHTMAFNQQGDIWFTVQQGNKVGRLDAQTLRINLYEVPTADARPYGLVMQQNQPWIALFGSNKLATVNNGVLQEIELPRKFSLPRRIALTPDGKVWYVDYAGGYLGHYDPLSGNISEWQTPAGANARPYALAADKNGILWFVETGVQPNRLVGFSPASAEFTQPVAIQSGGGTVRHMVYDPASHSLWFGTDTNTLAQAKL